MTSAGFEPDPAVNYSKAYKPCSTHPNDISGT